MRGNEEFERGELCLHESGVGAAGAEAPGLLAEGGEGKRRRKRRGATQFPMQILIPEETRDALRQRSADTGASIRHIILRSLAADGFPVPKLSRWTE